MSQRSSRESVYAGFGYPAIRQLHDQIYFGRWRGVSVTDRDLEETWRQLQTYVRLLAAEVGPDAPSDQRDYLMETVSAMARSDPLAHTGSEMFQAMNAALSYGHRLLNLLLRSRGETNHVTRDFAQYYGGTGDEDV